MSWSRRKGRVRARMTRTIGLSIRGRVEPELYRVCDDVFGIVGKMLGANEAIGPFSRRPRFEFGEVYFVLELVGAPVSDPEEDAYSSVDLWISEG